MSDSELPGWELVLRELTSLTKEAEGFVDSFYLESRRQRARDEFEAWKCARDAVAQRMAAVRQEQST